MEKQQRKNSADRRGVQSLFIPNVPQIVLNANDKPEPGTSGSMPHSRSAGELAMCTSSESGSSSKTSPASVRMCNGGKDIDSPCRNVIDIYCSPRLPRRTFNNFNSHGSHFDDDNIWLDSGDCNCLPNKLGPGSRVGSAVSLTSEYTSRSVGLISNDSSSDSTQFSDKLEQIKQKQNLLRRYVSNPEKQQNEIVENQVQRCAQSVNNLHNASGVFVGNIDQTDGPFPDILQMSDVTKGEVKGSKSGFDDSFDDGYHSSLVTMVTDELALKEGRVRQWLTEIGTTND